MFFFVRRLFGELWSDVEGTSTSETILKNKGVGPPRDWLLGKTKKKY